MEYKPLQPKKRTVVLEKGIQLKATYQSIAKLQNVIAGQQRGMMHPIVNRYDPKTKSIFY